MSDPASPTGGAPVDGDGLLGPASSDVSLEEGSRGGCGDEGSVVGSDAGGTGSGASEGEAG